MENSIEVITPRTPDGMGFSFKVTATGRLYRFEPTRCPGSPRFWCFKIHRCASGGMADGTERPWLGGVPITRDELVSSVAAIRADVVTWLNGDDLADLRRWIFAPKEEPVIGLLTTAATGSRKAAAS